MPGRQFWSLSVYDRRARAFVENPQDQAGLASFNMDTMKVNADGSVDLYFGPKAPDGLESNWITTMGKEPCPWLRLDTPEGAFGTNHSRCPMK